jgi:hypothetical protein
MMAISKVCQQSRLFSGTLVAVFNGGKKHLWRSRASNRRRETV